jgi:hypothetical protein
VNKWVEEGKTTKRIQWIGWWVSFRDALNVADKRQPDHSGNRMAALQDAISDTVTYLFWHMLLFKTW